MKKNKESKNTGLELAQTVLRQGELRLAAQLQVALASDQRALLAATILTAIAMAVFGFAVGWLKSGQAPIGMGAIAVSVVFFRAAWKCSKASFPQKFGLAGAQPKKLVGR